MKFISLRIAYVQYVSWKMAEEPVHYFIKGGIAL